MGPFVTAFSQISPTRNTELSHIFITYGFKLALHPVHLLISLTTGMMSMIGFAQSPGTEVLPM